jgi:hypothetical protein
MARTQSRILPLDRNVEEDRDKPEAALQIVLWQRTAGFSFAGKFAYLRPARCLRCFLRLSDLSPTRLLGQRDSPAPCSGKCALDAMRRPRASCCARSSGKLFEDRNSFPKLLDLVLRIPAFLAEPVDSLSNICHQVPPRVTTVGHCITNSALVSEFIAGQTELHRTWLHEVVKPRTMAQEGDPQILVECPDDAPAVSSQGW